MLGQTVRDRRGERAALRGSAESTAEAIGIRSIYAPSEMLLMVSLAILLGSGHLWLFYRAGGQGNLIATYPWLSSDSFDYIFQAVVLRDVLSGHDIGGFQLPLLRNPGLVALLALDGFAVDFRGDIFFAVSAVLTTAALAVPAVLLAQERLRPSSALVPCMLLLFSPTSYFRGFILADHAASVLMYLSAAAFVMLLNRIWCEDDGSRTSSRFNARLLMHVAGIAGVIGGVFQIYALYPLLAFIGVCLLR